MGRTSVEVRYAPLHVRNAKFSQTNSWFFPIMGGFVLLWFLPFFLVHDSQTAVMLFQCGLVPTGMVALWDWWMRSKYQIQTGTIRIDETAIRLPSLENERLKDKTVSFLWKDLESIKSPSENTNLLVFKFNSRSWDKQTKEVAALWGTGDEIVMDMRAFAKQDQNRVQTAVRRYAPQGTIAGVKDATAQKETSYTELWLQSLESSPRRFENSTLERGTFLDDHRYEVMCQLATGGQATTYEAFDHCADVAAGDQQRVVLKEFIVPAHASRTVVHDMFLDIEAVNSTLKALASKNIVKLYRIFYEDLRVCQVIEFIDGKSLRDLVREHGWLPPRQVIDLAIQMSVILDLLHQQSPPVVHRDFTPDNLILTSDGTLIIIDFDVAMSEDRPGIAKVVGKPSFVAPEQFRGQPGTASDLYSMGATMFFLLTGKDPTPISVSKPASIDTNIDSSLNAIVAKLTALTPEDRYKKASDVKVALVALENEIPGHSG